MTHLDRRDRTVHAERRVEPRMAQAELVRYDRQGRWYVEYLRDEDGSLLERTRVKTVHDAAALAVDMEDAGGKVYEDRPGGGRFDYIVQSIRAKRSRA